MVGFNGLETNMLMGRATARGPNITMIEEVLGHLSSAPAEEHKSLHGARKCGTRWVQKTSWTQETCGMIGLILENEVAHRLRLATSSSGGGGRERR